MASSKQAEPKGAPRTSAAAPTADLVSKVGDPGFTPSVRLLGGLLDLLAHDDDDVAKNGERAILRIEAQYAAKVANETVLRSRTAERPARGRLTRLAGRLAQDGRDPDGTALAWLVEALADADPKTRRAAARALGNVPRSELVIDALAHAFDRAPTDDDKRVLAVALGKMGGEAARTRVAGRDHGRASVIAERELAREAPDAIDPARIHEGALRIWFHTRSGLEDVLKEELGKRFGKARFVAPGVVEGELTAPTPLADALSVRTATHVGFPLAPLEKSTDPAEDIVRGIESPAALGILRAFTTKPEGSAIRFRIELTRGGHQRSVMWRVAERVRASGRELLNDPKASPWEVVIDEVGSKMKIELVPRGYRDERFAYREDLVPASSHPTIAAALARVAPRSNADIVWDPFVGAGAELVERARLGPCARLIGTDIEAAAVDAARSNLERAGVTNATVERADASAYAPEGVTLIITNPPMGRRVHRGTHADLLERFVSHAARVLVPGGALVWLVPEPRRIRERAASAGLEVERAFSVDMGGFSAELGVYVKRAPRGRGEGSKRNEEPKRRIVGARPAAPPADGRERKRKPR